MLLDVYMKEKIKIGTKELIKYIVYGIIIWFAIGGFVTLLNNEMGCEYCTDPVRVYNYETDTASSEEEEHEWTMELYPVKDRLECVCSLEFSNWGGENNWYLCFEDADIFRMPEYNDPPSTHTSYYWIEVEHCPWCGRELD